MLKTSWTQVELLFPDKLQIHCVKINNLVCNLCGTFLDVTHVEVDRVCVESHVNVPLHVGKCIRQKI